MCITRRRLLDNKIYETQSFTDWPSSIKANVGKQVAAARKTQESQVAFHVRSYLKFSDKVDSCNRHVR